MVALTNTHTSSSGLGLATVEYLLEENAYVAILDLRPPEGLSGPHVKFWKLDIRKVDQIETAVDACAEWTKETDAPLAGVINCAGLGLALKASASVVH